MNNKHYGMPQTRDRLYGAAAALTYWVFKSRDRKESPAMGTKTWTYLESSIRNCAEISSTLEDYLEGLSDKLMSQLRPTELTKILHLPQQKLRSNVDATEIKEMSFREKLIFFGWLDLLEEIAQNGFSEYDLLQLCRTKSRIISLLCRLKFEEDRAEIEEPEEAIEVEAVNV